jgi:hypothetical protein
MVVVVILSASGEIREGKLTGAPTAATVAKVLRKTKQPTVVGSWEWSDMRVSVWGWREAAKGAAENKHDLPSPCDDETLFGDAVAVATALEGGDAQDLHEDRWLGFLEDMAAEAGDSDSDSDSGSDEAEAEAEAEADEIDADEASDGEESTADEEGGEEEEEAGDEAEGDEEEEAEEEDEGGDDDCFDEGDDGGGKRRAPRRRTMAAPEYRRLEMGLRSRIRLPVPVGKRAPRWQTAPELTEEAY